MTSLSRIHGRGYREAIGWALRCIPQAIVDRLGHVQFVCGVDPVFAGLHRYDSMADGRSYRETAHCCYPAHLARPAAERATTVVLPRPVASGTVAHELGHALHEVLRFDPRPDPITAYARTNNFEAFAEAFTAWMCPGYTTTPIDPPTLWLFDALAAGREAPAVR